MQDATLKMASLLTKKCVFDLCFLSKLQLCSSMNYMPEMIFSNKRSSHPEVFLSKATLLKPHFSMAFSCKFVAYFQNTFY